MSNPLSRRGFIQRFGAFGFLGLFAARDIFHLGYQALGNKISSKYSHVQKTIHKKIFPKTRNAIRKAQIDSVDWQEWIREADNLATLPSLTQETGKKILHGQFLALKKIAKVMEEETAQILVRMARIAPTEKERRNILGNCILRFPDTIAAQKAALKKIK